MTALHVQLLAPWVGGVLLLGVLGGWLWRGLKQITDTTTTAPERKSRA